MSSEAASTTPNLSPEALEAEIASVTAHFNELRLNPDKTVATPEALNDAKKKLAELKKALALAKNAGKEKKPKDAAPAGAAGAPAQAEGKKKERLLLKTAKVRPGLVSVVSVAHLNLGYSRLWPRGDVLP